MTNILGVIAKPDLTDWKLEQAVLAALTLPRREGVVAEANRRFRRELGASPWELRLPDGRTMRSGDILTAGGEIVRADERQKCGGLPSRRYDGEWVVLEGLRAQAGLEVFGWDPKVFTYSQPGGCRR